VKERFFKRRSTWRDAALGAAAGIVGTTAMMPVTELFYRLEPARLRRKEAALRRNEPVEKLAARLMKLMGGEATKDQTKCLGQAIHWGIGAACGAIYAVFRPYLPVLSKARGLPFGVLFFLVVDEMLNTALGVAGPPQRYPMAAHARGLIGHIAFAVATDGTLRAANAARR